MFNKFFGGSTSQSERAKIKIRKTYFGGIISLEIPLYMVYNDKNTQILAMRERILGLGVDFFMTK